MKIDFIPPRPLLRSVCTLVCTWKKIDFFVNKESFEKGYN